MRILVINPNTTETVTDMVLAHCRAAHPAVQWQGATGRFGMAYIASEAASAIAAHAALDAWARHMDGHDAVLLACFGDPGLLALRELSTVPVVGLAQASFQSAAAGGPFGVVTGGLRWGPMLEAFARTHQLQHHLVGVRTVALTGADIAADPQRAMAGLAEACHALADAGAKQVVLGGAALAGLVPRLQPLVRVPLLDNVLLGAQAVVDAARRPVPQTAGRVPSVPVAVSGLDTALTAWLQAVR